MKFSHLNKDKFWEEKFKNNNHLRIGLCWSGNPLHKNNHNRSMSLNVLTELITLPFKFYSLQKDVQHEDLEILNNSKIIDYKNSLIDLNNAFTNKVFKVLIKKNYSLIKPLIIYHSTNEKIKSKNINLRLDFEL